MNNTKIEWTDRTWNIVTGCKHGCEYCYARKLAKGRLKHIYKHGFEPTFWGQRLEEPVALKTPARIFVSSMGDLFGDWVPPQWIEKVLKVVRGCPQHTFQLLTKNPARYQDFKFPGNCWLGTSVDNQETAEKRIPELLKAKAPVKFVSIEPIHGPVDIWGVNLHGTKDLDFTVGINWVIVGAETGDDPEPFEEEWVENIVEQCWDSDTPVFLKDSLNWPEKIQEWPEERREIDGSSDSPEIK